MQKAMVVGEVAVCRIGNHAVSKSAVFLSGVPQCTGLGFVPETRYRLDY